MTENFAWRFIPDDLWSRWRQIFNKSCDGMVVEDECPLCGKPGLLRWYALEFGEPGLLPNGERHLGHGRLWEWCGNCFAYEYMPDGYVPAWWQPPFDIDPTTIGATPQVVEEARRRAAAE